MLTERTQLSNINLGAILTQRFGLYEIINILVPDMPKNIAYQSSYGTNYVWVQQII
ncbi:hypothetical protein PSECIP111854_00313 [Pseudoalteromonas sp. CIP111854]|uniref:Uncharacterized protein n=1 Tax=Pseudoalteromonas holothuriae TaxID=2963714 RepID=A0A9W4QR25_9GAMM|nr:hypothetical protein PSECIP111854_00313 [Pseudoalteromonas sp. CIP111854]